jgi:hypothetical protein
MLPWVFVTTDMEIFITSEALDVLYKNEKNVFKFFAAGTLCFQVEQCIYKRRGDASSPTL